MRDVRAFMRNLMKSGGRASLDILNYNKDNTLSHNISHCMPLVDNCGINDCEEVSHIALVLAECTEIHHSSDSGDLLEQRVLEEVGMPLDRREGCNAYLHRQALPAPGINDWLNLTDGLALALLLRYMLRTRAPIALTDLEGRIVHVNPGWTSLTGYSAMEVEGNHLQNFLDSVSDPIGCDHFMQLMDLIRLQSAVRMHVNVLMNKKSRQSLSFSSASYRRDSSVLFSSSSSEKYVPPRHFGSSAAQEAIRSIREPTLAPQASCLPHSSQVRTACHHPPHAQCPHILETQNHL
jgi:PAS domain